MPNTIQYRYFHHNNNEWLADDTNKDDEEWQEAWALVNQEASGVKVEFTEDMYTNSEYSDLPDYINVTIKDDMILQYKMARGIIKSLDGATSIVFNTGIDCYTDDGWGNIGSERISIGATGAWVTINPKHGSDEVEVDVSEQFNQAIGETA